MRIYIYVCVFVFVNILFTSHSVFAQQDPFLVSPVYNPTSYNPAALGKDARLTLILRNQWFIDMEDPTRTAILNVDFSPFIPFDNKISVGLKLESDIAGVFNRTDANLLFAYHLINDEDKPHHLSLGVTAGILNQRIDLTSRQLIDLDDPIISNNSANANVFDGGLGLAYRYNKDNSVIGFDLSLPQLFTSDLNYKDPLNLRYDNRPHILAGLRYESQVGNIDLEPSILYQATGGIDGIIPPLNTFDIALRTFFLDKQFWVNTGTRINGNASYAGFGFSKNNIDFQGTFEFHREAGLTYEVLLAYRLTPTRKKTIYETELEKIHQRLENLKSDITARNNQVEEKLKEAERIQIYDDASKEATKNKLTDLEKKLVEVKNALDRAFNKTRSADNNAWRSERILAEAENFGAADRAVKAIHANNIKLKDELINTTLQNNEAYQALVSKVKNVRCKKKIVPTTLELIGKGRAEEVQARLNSDLSKIAGIDNENTVNTQGKEKWRITYTFPYSEDIYTLEDRINQPSLMMTHIKEQLDTLKGASIDTIYLKIITQDEIAYLKDDFTENPYLGELGVGIKFPHQATDTEDNMTQTTITEIRKGDKTSQYKLACLKLLGIRQYIGTEHPLRFEILAPGNIDDSTVCHIEIVLKNK